MKMLHKRSWEEFQKAGMLWAVNRILQIFGWSIVLDFKSDEKTIVAAYPVRTKFRGFGMQAEEEGYTKVTKYLKKNIDELIKENNL